MLLIRVVIFVLVFAGVIFSGENVFAQGFFGENIGGSAVCRLSGNVNGFDRKFKSSQNSLVISEADNTAEFTIELETFNNKTDLTIDLVAPLTDIDTGSLFNDDVVTSHNDIAEISLYKATDDTETEIINLSEDEKGNIIISSVLFRGKLNSTGIKASGDVKVRFSDTTRMIDTDSFSDETFNDKVIINCKFQDVPVTYE